MGSKRLYLYIRVDPHILPLSPQTKLHSLYMAYQQCQLVNERESGGKVGCVALVYRWIISTFSIFQTGNFRELWSYCVHIVLNQPVSNNNFCIAIYIYLLQLASYEDNKSYVQKLSMCMYIHIKNVFLCVHAFTLPRSAQM